MKLAFLQVIAITLIITITFTSINDDIQLKIIKQKEKLQESYTQLVIAKEYAEKATLAKTNFIMNISHEIRTPLNGIVGIADLLKIQVLNEEQKKLVQSLDISSKTLVDLINDLLDLSKIEANKLTLNNEIFDIRQTAIETNDLMITQIKDKNINLYTAVLENTPNYILLDRVKYKQVLINLLSNAIKFTNQGYINCTISYDANKSVLTTTVEDTGIGIADEHHNKLFTPFTQLNTTNSIENNGIGMGLAISKKLIELMDGEITVESTIEKGSCFKFTIPNITINQEAIARNKNTEKTNNKLMQEQKVLHILISEDHKINQIVLAKMLEKLNHTYEFANNGQEAVDICAHKTFDVILMDIQMPLINGIEATKIIVDNCKKEGRAVPKIIICSANVTQIDNKEQLTNYVTNYLLKPISLDQLNTTINNA
ncbi:ATP-binding protein [Sphingobacterium rhinopitheci]|uniref:ATP-binding protein n=1 Tax=Sphingobacterium rhinopitheci TaxID=2781960 RepID=UPI001F523B1B|nr:ATP-binding protein [Sphingobacterium rhinopitheci]